MNKIYKQYLYSYPHKSEYEKLNVDIKKQISSLEGTNNNLYIHIPFCRARCGYCNLFADISTDTNYYNQYLEAVERHAKQISALLSAGVSFNTLVIGGGTPLILNDKQLQFLFNIVDKYFKMDNPSTLVIESSPQTFTVEKIQILNNSIFNNIRISVGIQSMNEEELKTIGRYYKFEQCGLEYYKNSDIKFDCLNLDIIYGIPNQSITTIKDTINKLLEYKPNEFFAYPLYIKDNCNLYGRYKVDEETMYEHYRYIVQRLKDEGYTQTSMRRFTKDRIETLTCGFETSIAIGCGGRSYIGNVHWCEQYATDRNEIKSIIKNYIHKEDFFTNVYGKVLSEVEMKRRFVIKNLLHVKGISVKDYSNYFNSYILDDFAGLKRMIKEGYVKSIENKLVITELGLSFSDAIGDYIIEND